MGTPDDKFWADFLGVEPTDWAMVGVAIRPHVGLRGYRGLWCFRRNQRTVVSAPASWVPRLTEIVAGRLHDDGLMLASFLRPLDPIVEGLHAIREALAKASDNDLLRIAEAARERQHKSGHEIVRLPPKRLPQPQKAS